MYSYSHWEAAITPDPKPRRPPPWPPSLQCWCCCDPGHCNSHQTVCLVGLAVGLGIAVGAILFGAIAAEHLWAVQVVSRRPPTEPPPSLHMDHSRHVRDRIASPSSFAIPVVHTRAATSSTTAAVGVSGQPLDSRRRAGRGWLHSLAAAVVVCGLVVLWSLRCKGVGAKRPSAAMLLTLGEVSGMSCALHRTCNSRYEWVEQR